jgi:hypothetical protein
MEKKTESAANGAAADAASRALNGVRAAREGAARVEEVAAQWRNTSPECIAGRLAEELHAATFNVDAAAKGLNSLHAKTGAAHGASTAAADLTVTIDSRILDRAQVKYRATPASTTFEVAKRKYEGMLLVVPSDQVERIRGIAKRRGIDALGVRNYPDVAKGVADRVRSGGAESKPLSLSKARDAARNPQKVANELITGQTANAVRSGALVGAAIGGGISSITNLIAYSDGEKSGAQALCDAVVETTACAATGAAVSGASIAAEAALVRAGASALAGGAVPVAIGLTAVEVVKDIGRLAYGEIDGNEFGGRTAGHVVKGGTTWAGMEGGAALGTLVCPGVGTVVCGILGGVGGALLGSWLVD